MNGQYSVLLVLVLWSGCSEEKESTGTSLGKKAAKLLENKAVLPADFLLPEAELTSKFGHLEIIPSEETTAVAAGIFDYTMSALSIPAIPSHEFQKSKVEFVKAAGWLLQFAMNQGGETPASLHAALETVEYDIANFPDKRLEAIWNALLSVVAGAVINPKYYNQQVEFSKFLAQATSGKFEAEAERLHKVYLRGKLITHPQLKGALYAFYVLIHFIVESKAIPAEVRAVASDFFTAVYNVMLDGDSARMPKRLEKFMKDFMKPLESAIQKHFKASGGMNNLKGASSQVHL